VNIVAHDSASEALDPEGRDSGSPIPRPAIFRRPPVRINQGFPETPQVRHDELIARRRGESATPEDHQELVRLTAEA
jgi:hypothetical protein